MNGITYYRLKSDYSGDYTKDNALSGSDVDNNFYTLEGRDIKSINVDGKDIVITLYNGNTVKAENVLDFAKNDESLNNKIVNIEFDKVSGVLRVTNSNGTIQNIDGFSSTEIEDVSVATDSTIRGEGLKSSPLGVSSSARTGQYKTVRRFLDSCKGEDLPRFGASMGDRYVTCEKVSDFGYLYDYRAVREIACELKNTGWRIPTKEDWDDLLNAIEPSECDETHCKADKNKFLGKWAGRLLKSTDMWLDPKANDSCSINSGHSCGCGKKEEEETDLNDMCFNYNNTCGCTKESEPVSMCCDSMMEDNHQPLDAYGFRVTPAGYADDGCSYGYFKERAAFWTGTTNQDGTKSYMKRFHFNKSSVYQDVIASNYHLSLRLIKDYDGTNHYDTEEIMDLEYQTLLLPSKSKGKAIWTASNFACGSKSLSPMLPNNGLSLSFTTRYFIHEWDGNKWVRNEIRQGESVVIADAPNGKKLAEYRVIGDKFIDVAEIVHDEVLEEIDESLNNFKEDVEGAIAEVGKMVEVESTERKDKDVEIEAEIAKLKEKVESVTSEVSEKLEKSESNGNKVVDALTKEAADREEAIKNVEKLVDSEREERKAKDAEIEGRLIVKEGSNFDKNTGKLLLKSLNGTNDIDLQLSFNFGEF